MQLPSAIEPSQDILDASIALERAIVARFTGNTYYLMAAHAKELSELLQRGSREPRASVHAGKEADFETLLAVLRQKAEEELTENRYYLVLHKLDVLAFLAQGQEGGAAASQDEKAAKLGVEAAVYDAQPIVVPSAETAEVEEQPVSQQVFSSPCAAGSPELVAETAQTTDNAKAGASADDAQKKSLFSLWLDILFGERK